MKNGRINERNIGKVKLDGGCKRSKAIPIKQTSKEEDLAKQIHKFCRMILKDGIKVYETIPHLVQYWIDNGFAELKQFENTCVPARKFKPLETRTVLLEEKRENIENLKNLMETLYKDVVCC